MADIHHGNARNLSQLSDSSVNLIATSPPYNFGVDYEDHDDTLPLADYKAFLTDVLQECHRVLAPDGRLAMVVGLGTGQPMRDRPRIVKNLAKSVGFSIRDVHIWDKGDSESSSAWGSWRSASNPRQIFTHEEIIVFYKDDPGRREKRPETLSKKEFMEYVKSVWRVKPETSVPEHPAPYPPEIPERLVKLHSYEGDTVLDPFTGSGTTVAVADALGRDAIGVELSEEYVELARERVRGFSLQEPLPGL